MVTNGSKENHGDNQPFYSSLTALLHNGIIVNEAELWTRFPDKSRDFEVDTEIFSHLFEDTLKTNNNIIEALQLSFKELVGANTIAVIHKQFDLVCVTTSNSSLYFWESPNLGLLLFASEEFLLSQVIKGIKARVIQQKQTFIN